MPGRGHLMRVLLLASLLLTDVRSKTDAVFVYSRLGGHALLPCINPVPLNCSSITWTFFKGGRVRYTEEVIRGRVRADSDKSSRMSVTANCSVTIRDLSVDDTGSYVCMNHREAVTDVYLSLLTITSPSSITDLQLGGKLTLSCILFTYYDIGSCRSSSSLFNLSWVSEDGAPLPRDARLEQIFRSRCNVTVVTTLQRHDDNRKWRCQLSTAETSTAMFLDFTSTFLFQTPPTAQNQSPSAPPDCPVQLPISRIVLCVALPAMVIIVGLFTWRGDLKRTRTRTRTRTSAAAIELKDI